MSEDPRLAKLREIDDALAEKDWPKISPWWWRVITEFYSSGVLGCVITGGRRGGKSATIAAKVAIADLLTTVTNEIGEARSLHDVPPGDIGYFGMVSAEKPQAKARVATCKKALLALGFELAKDTTEEITIKGTRLGVMAVTASLSGVVSFTCIGFLCDEMALWRDGELDANPAEQVVASLKPTIATMPWARAWYVSAPWAELGLHYEMSQAGNDETQRVFHGSTWDMNPTLSEAQTRLLEKDEISWLRAYAAKPMRSDESKFFSWEFIQAAAQQKFRFKLIDRTGAGADFAFRRNSSALVVLDKQEAQIKLTACEERIPGQKALVPSTTIKDLAGIAVQRGADGIACDLHYIETVRETVDAIELPLLEYPSDDNATSYVMLRVLLSERLIDLSMAPTKLLEQLRETTSKPLEGGKLSIKNKMVDGAHGDLVSALVCAVWLMDQTFGDPMTGGNRRYARAATKGDDWDGPEMPDWP
jgi:hypothetical protein